MLKKYLTYDNFYVLLAAVAGLLLRAYSAYSNFYFSGELGKELLFVRENLLKGTVPLIGLSTSHEWLYYGPFYYWIIIPIFKMFNGNPYLLIWVSLFVTFVAVFVNYYVLRSITSKGVALFSSILQSISPLLIWQSRLAKLHIFFWILMPIFMFTLSKVWKGEKKWIFWSGVVFGLTFSFHFSQLPLAVVVLAMFWFKRNIYKLKDLIIFALGVVIPNITLVIKDIGIILWVPYKATKITENNLSETLNSVSEYLGKNLFWDANLWWIGSLVFALLFAHFLIKNYKKVASDFFIFYTVTSISVLIVANILHGSPPVHYFLPIFLNVLTLFAFYLEKYMYGYLVILFMVAINLLSFTKDPLFYKKYTGKVEGTDIVSYQTQLLLVDQIIHDSEGKEFSIKRIGPFDYFPEQYSQNYKYLLYWKKARLNQSAQDTYTIIEEEKNVYVVK